MHYNSRIHGMVPRDSSNQQTRSPHRRAGLTKLQDGDWPSCTRPPSLSPFTYVGFVLSGCNTSDCSSGVIFTIGGSLKRRDDASPYRQRVEGQSAGLTQAHEVVWPIFAGCHLQGLQRRPIAIPMPQGDQNPVNSGLGLFCPEPLLPDT